MSETEAPKSKRKTEAEAVAEVAERCGLKTTTIRDLIKSNWVFYDHWSGEISWHKQ